MTIPDVIVECGASKDDQVADSACFVVEVTSPGTRGTDLREKVVAYRKVSSVQGYLIVEQKRRDLVHATWRRRVGQGGARDNRNTRAASLGARPSTDDIYEGLSLPPIAAGESDFDEYTVEDYEREPVPD